MNHHPCIGQYLFLDRYWIEYIVEYAWIGLTAVDNLVLTSQPALASSLHDDLLFTKVSLVNFQISLSKI